MGLNKILSGLFIYGGLTFSGCSSLDQNELKTNYAKAQVKINSQEKQLRFLQSYKSRMDAENDCLQEKIAELETLLSEKSLADSVAVQLNPQQSYSKYENKSIEEITSEMVTRFEKINFIPSSEKYGKDRFADFIDLEDGAINAIFDDAQGNPIIFKKLIEQNPKAPIAYSALKRMPQDDAYFKTIFEDKNNLYSDLKELAILRIKDADYVFQLIKENTQKVDDPGWRFPDDDSLLSLLFWKRNDFYIIDPHYVDYIAAQKMDESSFT